MGWIRGTLGAVARVRLEGVTKAFDGNAILKGIDLDIGDGALAVFVGPSGCGKSTLLRSIAGLETIDAGRIRIGERRVDELAPRERDVAMVFQSYALYPHLRVRDNLAFGLKLRKMSAADIGRRVDEVSAMLGLGPLLDRYPRQLSGGQRQRVAMGRALARRAPLYLLDEPLSNLDAALRAQVRVEIRKLHDTIGGTMIYVTHDQIEAMTLADVLVVLRAGQVEQIGSPLEVYRHPVNRFVASFLGSPAMNFFHATVEDADGRKRAKADAVSVWLPDARAQGLAAGKRVVLGVRPEHLRPTSADDSGTRIDAVVEVVERMGWDVHVHAKAGDQPLVVRLEGGDTVNIDVGAKLTLSARVEDVHLFDD